jgi:nicotinamidase/pyrazinamidase
VKVLVLVDIQNDFCPVGALAVPEGNQVVPLANRLMRSGAFDLVVATKDWHPADHISFADNHEGKEVFQQIKLPSGAQTLWPRHCVQGTVGADLHPELDTAAIDYLVTKGTSPSIDSYSGFFDNGHQQETSLREILTREANRRGIPINEVELSVCGLALDYCVAATARDGANLGFKTEVILDACRAVNISPGDDLRTLRELTGVGVGVVSSGAILPERIPSRPVELRP